MNKLLIAASLAVCVPASAQVNAAIDPDDYETSAPASVKPEKATALGGAGTGATAPDARTKGGSNADVPEGVSKAASGGTPAGSSGGSAADGAPKSAGGGVLSQPFEFGIDMHKTPAPVGPLLKFARFRDAPHATNDPAKKTVTAAEFGNNPPSGTLSLSFNTGPGTTYSIGFKGTAAVGIAPFSQSLEGTPYCAYSVWISETPGGVSAGHRCGPIQTNADYLNWAGFRPNKVLKDTTCETKPGKQYWFNMKLDWWDANPYAKGEFEGKKLCVEYLQFQGAGGGEAMME